MTGTFATVVAHAGQDGRNQTSAVDLGRTGEQSIDRGDESVHFLPRDDPGQRAIAAPLELEMEATGRHEDGPGLGLLATLRLADAKRRQAMESLGEAAREATRHVLRNEERTFRRVRKGAQGLGESGRSAGRAADRHGDALAPGNGRQAVARAGPPGRV